MKDNFYCSAYYRSSKDKCMGQNDLIKVLSIDGGGIRGIIPAMVLAKIEEESKKKIAEMFDLIAGTSAGGIIALGLNVKKNGKLKPAEEIVKIFTEGKNEIFKPKSSERCLGGLLSTGRLFLAVFSVLAVFSIIIILLAIPSLTSSEALSLGDCLEKARELLAINFNPLVLSSFIGVVGASFIGVVGAVIIIIGLIAICFFQKLIKHFPDYFEVKYDRKGGLDKLLKEYFCGSRLGESSTNTFISTYDIKNCEPQFFKSWRCEHKCHKMWKLAGATSAAPTYFAPKKLTVKESREENGKCIDKERVLVDGGVFVNDPAMCAYAEVKRLQADQKEGQFCQDKPILIVSIGTGDYDKSISYKEAKSWGKLGWIKGSKILNVISDGVSDAVDYQLRRISGQDNLEHIDLKTIRQTKSFGKGELLYCRLNVDLKKDNIEMDDISKICCLQEKANKLIKCKEEEIKKICCLIK